MFLQHVYYSTNVLVVKQETFFAPNHNGNTPLTNTKQPGVIPGCLTE